MNRNKQWLTLATPVVSCTWVGRLNIGWAVDAQRIRRSPCHDMVPDEFGDNVEALVLERFDGLVFGVTTTVFGAKNAEDSCYVTASR